MFRKLWNKLFGKGPLFTTESPTFMGHEFKITSYNRKRLLEALEMAGHGSILSISKRTYVLVGHLPDLSAGEPKIPGQECEGDCENCSEFKGYGEEDFV